MTRSTEQEDFWEGEFGNAYTDRNRGPGRVEANAALFARALAKARNLRRVLELGSNIGLNLLALRGLLPDAKLSAVEINPKAAAELRSRLPDVELHLASILEFRTDAQWDLVFTKGVLIHLNPERLPEAYELMHRTSARYMLVAEYYNPKPVEIDYRGHAGRLFKRDFAGEMLDRFPGLVLIDYGFAYHRDPDCPQDDLTWFLMEKTPRRNPRG
jgi:spore coat polysaccharide biosynthesis protein SpsF